MNRGMSSAFALVIGLLIALAAIGIWTVWSRGRATAPTALVDLANCLKDSGAILYGSFWCSDCREQKRLFGPAAADLPYVECAGADSVGQSDICADRGITSYPTWIFADDTRVLGIREPNELANHSRCGGNR